MSRVFDAEARLGGTFLHPGGEVATRLFLDYLDLEPADQALELGCGLGASAALLARHSGATVVGLDRSAAMLRAARTQLEDQDITRQVRLVKADITKRLPFDDASFDAVYAESVVALLDPAPVLSECYRVLRPGGKLALNDRVWQADVSQAQVDEVNALSEQIFGFPAATPTPLDRDAWMDLLSENGFSMDKVVPTRDLPPPPDQPSTLQLRLNRYRHYLFQPTLVAEQIRYKWNLRRYGAAFGILEGFLFFAEKPSN